MVRVDNMLGKKFTAFGRKVWLSSPTMHGEELAYMQEAFKTNWMSTVGANINEVERIAAEKIGCPFSMPTGRKERPVMTKPREKTREELTAEIEESKKKIRQFENREKIIKQKLSVEERKARNHRLCKRGGFMESLVPELIAMPDEDAKAPRSDMAALPQQGAAPLAPLTRLSLHTHKNSTPAPASVLFLRVLLFYPGGDTHSHLPL